MTKKIFLKPMIATFGTTLALGLSQTSLAQQSVSSQPLAQGYQNSTSAPKTAKSMQLTKLDKTLPCHPGDKKCNAQDKMNKAKKSKKATSKFDFDGHKKAKKSSDSKCGAGKCGEGKCG